ncbi:HU family DNA-binding protein, partial [Gammaproteobacteria bacterium]|jgi:nucleoid DNA-binding protein|nr:HU family DNA-binding protein [Gammaproteobacteria bacterium]
MSLGKKDIVTNISTKAYMNLYSSSNLLNKFIELITLKSKKNIIKISNFGVFYLHHAPMRLGRNPKTREVFQISQRHKVAFKASSKVKSIIN